MSVLPLRSVRLRPPRGDSREFPYSVPAIRALREMAFPTPVTFLVGENGSGKSTLLEAIAAATGLPSLGSELRIEDDESLRAQRALGATLALTWNRGRASRGFFLRAEDFFGFTRTIARMRQAMLAELAGVEEEYRERSAHARGLREGPLRASIGALEERYGVDLDAQSHGQSFLAVFKGRFVPRGLYLMDEPEAPLSPQSQLALLAMLRDMAGSESQFIIATHSPILLAYPEATIYSFDESPPAAVAYESLEHVAITRDFLADPHRYLRQL